MLLNCCVGEDAESPVDCKEIQPVNPKGNQPWIFIGRTNAEAPILWPPDAKSRLIGKDPDAGKDCRQEEKGETEDEMVGWHHWLNGDSGRWWRTGKPGVLQFKGSQRVRHDLATGQQQRRLGSRWGLCGLCTQLFKAAAFTQKLSKVASSQTKSFLKICLKLMSFSF